MNDQRGTLDHDPPRMRRSQGQIIVARALWYTKPGQAELRTERLAPPAPGEARIATEYSAISRGTERLIAHGEVPQSEWTRMRAPLQAGAFSFPIKYGYSAAGIVTVGPDKLIGRRVFALHPHQDHFQVTEDHLLPIPDAVPSRRAVLAANMETALNAHWDAGTSLGDRVLVVGAGMVGLLVAYLAQRIAGTDVTITDINPARASYAAALGLTFTDTPRNAPHDNLIVFHTSATGGGFDTAIEACAFEGRVIELSWYGTHPVTVNLGGAFHARRLQIISSQVGHVAPSHRSQLKHRERLERALALLDDPALDVLVSASIPFTELPKSLPDIWSSSALPPIVCY
ncbi:alcohol dehydrogenase zinc-binding domain-containing protein [Hyphomicrobium denitrificans 1NES1]|uniref:Alcohol dehydrogenase zinc-binding domain-containing protein n=1 Tax=Hyphomicrobium denitrificans 1NES1 TaxID=670307 RepID=N0BBW9_9HYPH|nr:zinc-binding alcohol dehydrogenase [Hyphomicrobium denitrificans]AGK57996.1 alcohol dehydrogenase zinc-binding domain-containing protein [Hyphomicrobium denitrificans 1NES1]